MKLLNKYIKYFDSRLGLVDDAKVGKDLAYWRDLIFVRFLSFILPIGLLVVIPSTKVSIKMGLIFVAAIDVSVYIIIVFVSLRRSLSIKTKKKIFVIVIYLLSISLLLVMGLTGPGFLYLLAVSLIITLTISSNAGYFSVLSNGILAVFFSFSSHYGWLGIPNGGDLYIMPTLVIGANFVFINLFLVIAISYFLRGLSSTLMQDRFLRQKAEESDDLKSAFLANISHEIRTPLNAILGFSDLTLDSDYDESEKEVFLHNIQSSGEQLISIIDSIVDISVIESGQMTISYSLFSLSDVMNDCFSLIQNIEKSENVVVEFQKNDEVIVTSDRKKLIQVLTNLLTNALKFTKAGKVRCRYFVRQDEVIFNVNDTGIGISEEVGENLFKRFYKIQNSLEFKSGTGLGLAISKGILEALGGKIWYESEVGIGTDFYFSIPISNTYPVSVELGINSNN